MTDLNLPEQHIQEIKISPELKRKHHWRGVMFTAVVLLVAVGAWAGVNYFWKNKISHPKWQDQTVGLVSDKVSASANVIINLPNGVSLTSVQAETAISFSPELKGVWSAGPTASQLIFRPAEKLVAGKFYRVNLASGNIRLSKDFQADEDPKILSIFPKDGSEAPETSEITIEFNRPMVPLTTLDEQVLVKIPVEITPATPGSFRWVTTRTLKFLPQTRLLRSSNYTVKVNSGFVSMDGLPVDGAESKFTTRPLRYASDTIHHQGVTLYDEPVRIDFNQPVNLDETKKLIEVKNTDTNSDVAFVAEYGSRSVVFGNNSQPADYTDKSVIYVYQNKDHFNRAKFWDSKTKYSVLIKGAAPLEGDVKLEDSRSVQVQVPDVIKNVSADSPRSNLVEPGMFDPKGHLVINFYEDIDKTQTQIKAKNLSGVDYGQKCALDADGNGIYLNGGDCQKEPDKTQLVLSFKDEDWQAGENFQVELQKIVNAKGLLLNSETLKEGVTILPKLQVLQTFPKAGESGASVTDLILCTNSPLDDAQPENFYQRLKSNISVGKWNWDPAFKVSPQDTQAKCSVGQYENFIHYGLAPKSNYQLNLDLVDQFGQNLKRDLSFTTGDIASTYTGFNSLQKGYNVTSPALTKLTFAAENLDYVDVHVCQVSGQTMVKYLDSGLQPSQTTPGSSLDCIQTWQKRIDLPPKYWDLNYFQFDLKDLVADPLGYYVLSFSNPNLHEQVYNYQTQKYTPGGVLYNRTFLNVTNLAVQEKKVEVGDGQEPERITERRLLSESQGNLYWVTQIGSLDPVEGASVQVFQKTDKNYVSFNSATTDAQGVARAAAYSGDGAAIVSKDNDSTLVSSYNDKFQWSSANPGGDKTYIYSDRPIYRPGQTVNIKGLYRIGYDSVYEIYQKPVHVDIYDSKDSSVYSQDLKLTPQGTFSLSFDLPSDAALGSYRVQALGGYYSFDVEEYVPAAFKLDLSTDKDEYIAGDTFNLSINANYYFGVPLESGKVDYTVVAQNYYFDRYQDQYFQFGAPWYYGQDQSYGDNYILRGKAIIGSDGKAQISQKLDFDKLFSEQNRSNSKIFVVNVTATNSTGQAVSGQQSFIVHRGEFYLGVNLQKDYFAKNDPNKILIKTVDTQGKEKSVSSIKGKVNQIKWHYDKRQEVDGNYYYHSEKTVNTIKEFTAQTDGSGNYSMDFTVPDEGEYEVDLTATDSRGNNITATQEFYVYGSGTVDVEPLNNESLDLAVANSKLEVGQQGQVVIKSPFSKAKALVAVESGRILDYQIIDVNSSFYNYTFDAKASYVPNVYLTVLLLSDKPEVRFGQAQFYVDTKEKTITIEAKPNKNHYLPGEEVTLDVTTKDAAGNLVPADVSVSVADLSVLALAGNPKKDPVSFFYNGRPLGVTTSSNIKNILQETPIPSGTKGGSGSEPGDLAAKKRGVFKDTAYWSADVQTDNNGHAQVKFTLPDNLTTWQIESLGLTKDTKLGVGYQQFTAQKQLMVTPLVPRFIIPGDEFVVGGKVFNQTGSSQTLQVSFASQSLEFLGSKDSTLKLNAGETKTVYVKVRAPAAQENGSHTINITAKNSDYVDSVDSSFPVNRNETYEAVATSNYTTDQSANEYVWLPSNVVKDRGGLTVGAAATLVGTMQQALDYLVGYPYGCTEQMVSKLGGVAAVKRFLSIKNLDDKFVMPEVTLDSKTYSADDVVDIGLTRIISNQNPDGGFAYYQGMQSDYYLTLDVLDALEQLKQADYAVDGYQEQRAADYVFQKFNSDSNLNKDKDTLILTTYVLSEVPGGSKYQSQLEPGIEQLASDKKFFNEDISNLSLVYLALLESKNQSSILQQQVFTNLENRVEVDGRGAYLAPSDTNNLWQYYESPIKDTALLIKAESLAKRDYAETPKLLTWLRNSRSKDGSWGSTNNTVTVLDSMVDYLQFKQETESNFSLDLLLNGQTKASKTFNSQSILDSLQAFIPTADFAPDKLSTLQFNKKDLNSAVNGFYYDMSLKYYLPIENIAPKDEGFGVEQELYALDDKTGTAPLTSAKVGDVLRGHLIITVGKERNFVAVESYIPAGMELVNFNLATADQTLQNQAAQNQNPNPTVYGDYTATQYVPGKPVQVAKPGFWSRMWQGIKNFFANIWNWILHLFGRQIKTSPTVEITGDLPDGFYSDKEKYVTSLNPDFVEYHDDRLMLFNQNLQPGVYEYDYFVRALIPGKFQHLPAVASELYTPENFGRTRGEYFNITQ